MPITTGTKWDEVRYNQRARFHFIVKLTDGVTTWLVSDKEMILTDGHVYQLLDTNPTLTGGVDLYTKQFSMSDVQVTMRNAPVFRDTGAGDWLRPSDVMGNVRWNAAFIYVIAGERMASLSDCLLRFSGAVLLAPEYTDDTLKLTLTNWGRLLNRNLPKRRVVDVYASAPAGYANQRIPLVWGTFENPGGDGATFTQDGVGLAVGVLKKQVTMSDRGVATADAEFVFADHVVASLSTVWQQPGTVDPGIYQAPTKTVNDSGLATAAGDVTNFYLHCNALVVSGYWLADNSVTPANSYDRDDATGDDVFADFGSQVGYGFNDDTWAIGQVDYDNKISLKAQILGTETGTVASSGNEVRLYYASDGTSYNTYLGATHTNLDWYGAWEESEDFTELDVADINQQLAVGFEWLFTGSGTMNPHELRAVLEVTLEHHGSPLASLEGRAFGTWINNGVTPTTTTFTIAGSTGDAQADDTTEMVTASGFSRIGYNATNGPRSAPFVFAGITVPQGADIHKAVIKPYVTARSDPTGLVKVKGSIYVVDEDNTALLTNGNRAEWDARAQVVGSVDYEYRVLLDVGLSARLEFPDIAHLIQEVIDRPGWSSGNRLGIYIDADNATSDGYIEFESYDDSPTNACQVTITYTPSASGGRRTFNVSGDVIEDPVLICESILRDVLELSADYIDVESFTNAADREVVARLNLHEGRQMGAMDAIRTMAEQGRFLFTWSTEGKAAAVSLVDKTPTTDRTIHYSHILNGQVKVSKTKTIRNRLQIDSKHQEEHGGTRDSTTVNDTTSITALGGDPDGVRQYRGKWLDIADDSVAVVAANLVNTTDGLWSKEHVTIVLTVTHIAGFDLIEGDWIGLDPTSVDPHLKYYGGASWSGKQFLITGIKVSDRGTQITAMELWA